jgi:uncharacterized membrane protein
MEINGLPLHPLAVHAAVVFGPVAALSALVYLLPQWRDRARWPMVALAVVATGALVLAYYSGGSFLNSKPELEASPLVQTHKRLGRQLLWVSLSFGVVAVVSGWIHARSGALRVVLDVLVAATAVVLLVWVFRTGEAGARAVWG